MNALTRRIVSVAALAIGFIVSPRAALARRAEVAMTVPVEVAAGETFDVPVSITAGKKRVMSYAIRLQFDPRVLKVVSVQGGTFDGFAADPVSNAAAFESGVVDFTANNAGFIRTPESFTVAMIKLTSVSASAQETRLQLGITPGNGLVNGRFRQMRVRITGRSRRLAIR